MRTDRDYKDIDLQGIWQFSLVDTKGEHYSGKIVIDGSNRVHNTMKTPHGVVFETGSVTVSGNSVDMIFTHADASKNHGVGYNPDRFHCTLQSKSKLSCGDTDTAGHSSKEFTISRND